MKAQVVTVEERKSGKFNWDTMIPIISFHVLALGAFFTFSWANLAAFAVMWWLTGSVGIGLSFHRQLTHGSFQSPQWFKRLIAVFGSMALQGSAIDWVTTHRIHHAFCETEKDPHSPRFGTYWSHIGWISVGTSQDNAEEIEKRYVPDLLKDKFLVNLSKYWYVPIIISSVILYFIGGFSMVIWGTFLTTVLGWHFTWFVNSVTHIWGKRRFETRDDSTNNGWIAAVSFGEGWHNNHHAFPTSARHGLTWKEFDFNWIQIKILEKLGLVWKVKEFDLKAHEAKIAKGQKTETVEAPEVWQEQTV